ncbi:beta-glucosidase family protein [Streptomyces nigrescens]|uniref:Glycoside hydrolase family 3 C-terminal domain-containing protein n=1 Tax=Streptomyces nigrescens TaxID=1920 RepID=A0ABY7J7X4_STRNI|nr:MULTISPECIES: glycoside hydrolase family 3 C-terminal domain-containing protein [Streptomyces]MCX5449197.1 glycoside hydrolase family 3 C-terminal domain-containing protein [Streptomyces libani]WAU07179.1 glycoside hydrolase family 3 C-terminal domain-containing protein [Streptomyces nigrescens]
MTDHHPHGPAADAAHHHAGSRAHEHTAAVERALATLDLDTKVRLLSGQDMWTLPAVPAIGLRSLVMSDGPVGVRGQEWNAGDPSVALPSPTALAATWDPELARRAGHLLAQEARRKGVHVLLAPTVNLHRSPLGGRHFECYAEDPLLTGVIGAGYVRGVQEGGVGATVKHFVGNDAETDRLTVDNRIAPRPLRELYLAPFEHIVENARPWAVMTAYNQVNGSTMTEHRALVQDVLRGEWGFDGCNVSDWTAARNTVRALRGGLDVAMPGPRTVYGAPLAEVVRTGEVTEAEVDAAVRRVLLLAARTGCLDGVPAAVGPAELPRGTDGRAVAREVARRACVLLRNEPVGARRALPLDAATVRRVAVIGTAAREARVLGGGSATVFPDAVVSPLEGLRAALPDDVEVTYAAGADPRSRVAHAREGFTLRARYLAADGRLLAETAQSDGKVRVMGRFPEGVTRQNLGAVELTGSFTPQDTGHHTLAVSGTGELRLTVGGAVLFDGRCAPAGGDPFEAFLNPAERRVTAQLTAGERVEVTLRFVPDGTERGEGPAALTFALGHRAPQADADAELAEAVRAAAAADVAIVVVATTEETESEGFDRGDLRLPGRQDELVRRVAAANPHTVVVVNSGSPVELPWREQVPAVLLSWFPGQEAGAALADVLLGAHEPGGRLPTTWPARLDDAPVTTVTPADGQLDYAEGVFIGYRAWQRSAAAPAYPFGHGLGYTDWEYESLDTTPDSVRVRIRNAGDRPGREVVQIYLAPTADAAPDAPERPARWLAGFAVVEAGPGESAEAEIPLPDRAFAVWDAEDGGWHRVKGVYLVEAAHSVDDRRLTAEVTVG